MDNQTAQEILSAYRYSGEDANDPFFHEALAQCEHDPAMKRWLVEQRTFDEQLVDLLNTIPAPESGKRTILALAKTDDELESTRPSFWRRYRSLFAIAAAVTLAFVLMNSIVSFSGADTAPAQASGETGLTDWIAQSMPLEFHHEDTRAVLTWLAEHDAPVPEALSSDWLGTSAEGCRIFKDPQGGTISLICLQVDGELVHVFIFDQEAAENFDAPRNKWWQEAGYNLIAQKRGNQLVALATRAEPSSITHLL